MIPQTMNAVTINSYGDLDTLKFQKVEVPKAKESELLIELYATGLNPADFKIRRGDLKEIFPISFPGILGGEMSGKVVALGPNTSSFKVGDEVFFSNPLHINGGNAEYVTTHETFAYRKPKNISHIEAASLPISGFTAIQALRNFSKLKKDQKVLIHAGAGGVGSFAIQYAKFLGAKVFTTGSSRNVEYLKSLGADVVINYKEQDFVEVAKKEGLMDVTLEAVGGENYARSIKATKEGGAIPCIVHPPKEDILELATKKNINTDFLLMHNNQEDIRLIHNLVEQNIVRPTVTNQIELKEVSMGHKQLESGTTRGKWVIDLKA